MDSLLKELLTVPGVSGYEYPVADILKKYFSSLNCEINSDSMGNLIVWKGKGKKKIMLAAHMDEIGLVVKHITKDGFIKFIKIGGIDDRILLGKKVKIINKNNIFSGVIASKPPHLQKEQEQSKVINYQEMFIDAGFSSQKEAEEKISIGNPIIFDIQPEFLSEKLVLARAADDRVGCFIVASIMKEVSAADSTVYAVTTVQEEVGLKGARTASFNIKPDFALIIDTTIAGDSPGIDESQSSLKLGKGVAISFLEAGGRGTIIPEPLRDLIINIAQEKKIPYQISILEGGMTDGAIVSINREGIPTVVLSVPCRYIHAPASIFHLDDIQATVKLALAIIEYADKQELGMGIGKI